MTLGGAGPVVGAVVRDRADRDRALGGGGLMVQRLERAFRDGVSELLFEPLDFLARLGTLTRRQRST